MGMNQFHAESSHNNTLALIPSGRDWTGVGRRYLLDPSET
jgi:hypothetical protein